MNAWTIPALLEGLEKQDLRALSRSITIVENHLDGAGQLMNYAFRATDRDTLVIGITGAAGAGKSTLIDKLIGLYCAKVARVGVLAVDPSSPYTGGAVLGDRIRMGSHNGNESAFIRSFASRGIPGGICQGAKDALYLYRAFGFDLILLESLGVGQAETDISLFSDVTLVVLAPGNGDAIQLAKAGTQEIADIFVINKSDRPEADTLYAQLLTVLETISPEKRPLIAKASAAEGQGITELADMIQTVFQRNEPQRMAKMQSRIENEIWTNALQALKLRLNGHVRDLTTAVQAGRLTPYDAAKQVERLITIHQPPLPHEGAEEI